MTYFPRFVFPWALLLLLLVPWSIWVGAKIQSLSQGRKWTAITLRAIILVCLISALAGAEIVRVTNNLAVFFLLDHSNSVPEEHRMASAQWVRNVSEQYMTEEDKAGVIVFGEEASVELQADERLGLRDIMSYVGGEQTDLAAAVRLAMAAFPQGHMKRMVIYSDGNETQGNAIEEVKLAEAAGVAVDVVPLHVDARQEVKIKQVSTPNQADADEPFQLRVVASATEDMDATLRVYQRIGEQQRLLPSQQVTLQEGDNTFLLNQELTASGFYEYEVTIESESDSVLANNEGRSFTVVQGEPRVLVVDSVPARGSHLVDGLMEEGIGVTPGDPGSIPTSLAQFQNYDAVVLSNVSSVDLSSEQLNLIEAAVRDLGIGLIMIGGPDAFGAGGYLDTPVEKALPVDMDIKQRKVLPRGALAAVLHTVEFPDGNAWAMKISLAALNVLSSQDLMGVLGYLPQGDGWIHRLAPVGDKVEIRRRIRVGSTQIGDMPAVGPTLSLAYRELVESDAAAKRVLIISDGDPAPPPRSLVTKLQDAGIAVSTVCINPHSPNDTDMLRRLAEATGGQYYFVKNPNNLPQIFTKEAAIVKRGLLYEDPFLPQPNHDSELLMGLAGSSMPELLGYVVTTAKDSATVPLISNEGDPVLAHWRYGLGKSIAFTSDATNRWAANWLSWPGYNRFWAQAVRWVTRELTPTNFRVDTFVRDGEGHVRIDAVDDEGNFINYLRPRGILTGPAPDFERSELELEQTGPGIYEASFPLSDSGVYMMNLLYDREDGTQGTIPAGLALGYSPEYEYTSTNMPLLEKIASTGGGQIADPDYNPFVHNLEATPSVTPIWHILAAIAACLLPIEIFVRRVVIPFAAVYAPIAKALRKVPAIGRWVPRPAPQPAPVTGTYSAAPSRQFQFSADGTTGESSFGIQTSTTPPEGPAPPAEETEELPAEKKAGHSDYTRQLLEAKERAIAKKSRRVDSEDNES